jgi:phosphopantothenoylcysteine decarboxylase/phosphopantothenate--cysteine ligase
MDERIKHRRGKKRIVLGVSGSIACYKAVELARYCIKRGFQVRVVMTESATKFVTPLTFEAITGFPVVCSFWEESSQGNIGHIELADWADIVVVAPATADTIAKMAIGSAESSLLAVVLATKAPVVVAPAMNVNMYEHPQTQENLDLLRSRGVDIVEPEVGVLACRWKGKGRLAEPHEIFAVTERALSRQDLVGVRVLITAGPTREALDPVRFLSNRSSGKMGLALAREAYRRGASVTVVHGPIAGTTKLPSAVRLLPVVSAEQMAHAVLTTGGGAAREPQYDVVIMAAAVADYRPREISSSKMKKAESGLALELVENVDIARSLGEMRGGAEVPLLVGFAVETGDSSELLAEAQRKLTRKGLDFMVGNLANDSFDRNTNKVVIVSKHGAVHDIPEASKRKVSQQIWDRLVAELTRQGRASESLTQ